MEAMMRPKLQQAAAKAEQGVAKEAPGGRQKVQENVLIEELESE